MVTFKVPIKLSESYTEKNPGSDIRTAVNANPKYKNSIKWIGDKLRMEADLTKTLFNDTCKRIVNHMQELLKHSKVKDVSSIILVGGFAESPMLQAAIRNAFKDKKVIVPRDAGLAVLKGAVLFGHQPKTFSARICKYTYGIGTTAKFNCFLHPESKKIIENDEELCTDIFSIHVRVGDTVDVGEPQGNQTYTVVKPYQRKMDFLIYTSNVKSPKFVTDEGCTRVGKLAIDMPDTSEGMDRGAKVHMTFSGTEFVVTAVDKRDPQKIVSTTVDFLG